MRHDADIQTVARGATTADTPRLHDDAGSPWELGFAGQELVRGRSLLQHLLVAGLTLCSVACGKNEAANVEAAGGRVAARGEGEGPPVKERAAAGAPSAAGSGAADPRAGGSGAAQPHAGSPSFDCGKARTPDELTICDDVQLSEIDHLVAKAFKAYQPSFQKRMTVVKRLLKNRNACGTDKTCIIGVQAMTLQTFSKPAAWVTSTFLGQLGRRAEAVARGGKANASEMPSRVGDCVRTRVASVEARLGGPLERGSEDMGAEIAYTCGGGGVTYQTEPWMYDVKAGDVVVVCLTFVPHDCPDGDDRGREYYILHPSSGATSTLGDSQHGCGGA